MSDPNSPSHNRKRKRDDGVAPVPTPVEERLLQDAISRTCAKTTFFPQDFDAMNIGLLRDILQDAPELVDHFLDHFSSPLRNSLDSPQKYLYRVLSGIKDEILSSQLSVNHIFKKYGFLDLDSAHKKFVHKIFRDLGSSASESILKSVSTSLQAGWKMRNRNAVLMRLLQRNYEAEEARIRISSLLSNLPETSSLQEVLLTDTEAILAMKNVLNRRGMQESSEIIRNCITRLKVLSTSYPVDRIFFSALQMEETIYHLKSRPEVFDLFQEFLQRQKAFEFDNPIIFDSSVQNKLIGIIDSLKDEQCHRFFDLLNGRFQYLGSRGVRIRNPPGFLMSSMNEIAELIRETSIDSSTYITEEWRKLQTFFPMRKGAVQEQVDNIPREIKRMVTHLVDTDLVPIAQVREMIARILANLDSDQSVDQDLSTAHRAVNKFLREHPQNIFYPRNVLQSFVEQQALGLNANQVQAVAEDIQTPLMINAGPGTGKTSTLVARIFRLMGMGKSPHHIIAITFSNESQRSLLNRIQVTAKTICDNGPKSLYMPFVKTIDAFAAMISDWYLPNLPVLMEDDDFRSQVLLKLKNYPNYDEKELVKQLDDFYRKLKCTQDFRNRLESIHEELLDIGMITHRARLMWVVKFLQSHPKVLQHFQRHYHVLVDEFQDVDNLQYELIRLLVPPKAQKNNESSSAITVVGDDDQAIYAFRGGNVEPIINFTKNYVNAKVVNLTENYRTLQSIIDFNTRFISSIKKRVKHGIQFTSKVAPDHQFHDLEISTGGQLLKQGVHVCRSRNYRLALDHTFDSIDDLIMSKGINPSQIAMLAYTNKECHDFKLLCNVRGIKFAEEDDNNGILISTIHKAKGLERDIVFILWGFRDSYGTLWHPGTRRLFYVGCTRAKYFLHINYYFKKNYKEVNIFGDANIIADNNDISCAIAGKLSSDGSNIMASNDSAELLQCLDEKLLEFVQRKEPIDTGSELERQDSSTATTYSVSALASFFLFQCSRRLHRQMHNRPPTNVTNVLNHLTHTGPSISGLLKTAGLEWEESIVSWLRTKKLLRTNPPDGLQTNFTFRWNGRDENISSLFMFLADGNTAEQYLYEPSFALTSEICRDVGLPVQMTIRTIRPDFIKLLISPTGSRSLQIIDAKFSCHAKVHQKIQVALYCNILQKLIEHYGFSKSLNVHPTGGIWLPPNKASTIRPADDTDFEDWIVYFDTLYLKTPISLFLTKYLSNVGEEDDSDYHLDKVCSSCEHCNGCIEDATQNRKHLSLLPIVNRTRRKELMANGILDIEDVIKKPLPAALVRSYPKITAMAQSIYSNEIKFLGHGSSTFPLSENHRVVFLSLTHPINDSILYAGLLYSVNGQHKLKSYCSESYPSLVSDLYDLLQDVSDKNQKSLAKDTFQLFTYSVKDRTSLLKIHVDALTSDLRTKAEAVLRALFLEKKLAQLQDSHEDPSKNSNAIICLEQEIRFLFALPIPPLTDFTYIYTLFGGSNVEIKSEEYIRMAYLAPTFLNDQVLKYTSDLIHAQSELIDLLRLRIREGYKHDGSPGKTFQRRSFECHFQQLQPFKLIDSMKFSYTLFSKLAFLRLFSVTINCNNLRRERYSSFGYIDPWKINIISVLHSDYLGLLLPGSTDRDVQNLTTKYAHFFLIDLDDIEQVTQILQFRDVDYVDYKTTESLNQALLSEGSKLFVITLESTDEEDVVVVKSPSQHLSSRIKLNRQYALFQRFVDVTLFDSLNHLYKIDQSVERSRNFLDVVTQATLKITLPNQFDLTDCWSPMETDKLWVWGNHIGSRVLMQLTPSHIKVLNNLKSHPVSLMIGPPGTGKSFFLAGLLLARLRYCQCIGKKNVIIVTANTNSAMDSIMEKILRHLSQPQHKGAGHLESVKKHVIRVVKQGDIKAFPNNFEYVGSKSLSKLQKLIEKGQQVIIFGTIWQLLKVQDVIEKINIDMLCIDESSMMPMIDSALAFSLTRVLPEHGSIFLVGDHKQLGPVSKTGKVDIYCQVSETIDTEESLFGHLLSNISLSGVYVPHATLTHTWRLNQECCKFVATYMQYDGYEPANADIGRQRLAIRGSNVHRELEACANAVGASHSVLQTLVFSIDPDKPLVMLVIKSSSAKTFSGQQDASECKLVSQLARFLSASSSLQNGLRPVVMSMVPHHKKRRLLQKMLPADASEPLTIYQAQGKECDIGIVLYTSYDPSEIDRQRDFLFNPLMFNVAITRARLKTIVIVTEYILEAFPSALQDPVVEHGYKLFKSFYDHCQETNSVVITDISELVE